MNKIALIQQYEDKMYDLELLRHHVYMNPDIDPEVVWDRFLEITEATPVFVIDTTNIDEVDETLEDYICKYRREKYRLMVQQSQENILEGMGRLAILSQGIKSCFGM